jgi:tetratricopeptide (TPR) repeat protein
MKIVFFLVALGAVTCTALADSCSGTDAQVIQATRQLARSAVEAAEKIVEQVPQSGSSCPSVQLAKARIAALRGDAEKASAMFARYLEVTPDDPQGYAYFARLLIEQGDYSQADRLSETAIAKGPHDPAALAVRGQMLAMKGDRQKGVELLIEACKLAPDDAEAQFQLGAIYDRAKLRSDAAEHFRKAVALDPANARAWDYLALNLEPLGDIAGTSEAFKKALEVNREGPQFDSFLDYNYGRFLMKHGDLSSSKVHLDRAVKLVPDMRATWYERARLDLRLGDYQQARKDAEMAASLADPSGIIIDLQVYTILEQIYRRLGEKELADKYAELERQTLPPVRGERH